MKTLNTIFFSFFVFSMNAVAQNQIPADRWLRASFDGETTVVRVYAKGGGLTPNGNNSVVAPPYSARLAGISISGDFTDPRVLSLGFLDQAHPAWPGIEVFQGPYVWRTILIQGTGEGYLDRADLTDVGISGFLGPTGLAGPVVGETYTATLDLSTGVLTAQ